MPEKCFKQQTLKHHSIIIAKKRTPLISTFTSEKKKLNDLQGGI